MTFEVGSTDYSGHVIAGTYEVNNKPQYKTWEDGNHKTRRTKLRDQIVGSFNMFFRTEAEYEDFMDGWQRHAQPRTRRLCRHRRTNQQACSIR